MQEQQDAFDTLAKSLLNDLAVSPPAINWDEVQERLQQSNVDELFYVLKQHSTEPAPHNWKEIQRRLPLYVIYRRQLLWLGRVAAVLLLTLFLPQLIKQRTTKSAFTSPTLHRITTPKISAPTFGEVVKQAVEEQAVEQTRPRRQRHRSTPRSETELLLASVLTDTPEFPDSLLDLTRLQNILKPVKPLPVISAVARVESLPLMPLKIEHRTTVEVELAISIPLIFVEEGEAEQLIQLYDERH